MIDLIWGFHFTLKEHCGISIVHLEIS